MNTQKKQFNAITNQVHSLNFEQLLTLHYSYEHLQYYSDFFMTQQTYQEFMNRFHNTHSKSQLETFKTLITLLTTTYTNPERYLDTLKTIDLIKKNYDLFHIINIINKNK